MKISSGWKEAAMNKNNEKAKVRNCKELGSNLIKIFSI